MAPALLQSLHMFHSYSLPLNDSLEQQGECCSMSTFMKWIFIGSQLISEADYMLKHVCTYRMLGASAAPSGSRNFGHAKLNQFAKLNQRKGQMK